MFGLVGKAYGILYLNSIHLWDLEIIWGNNSAKSQACKRDSITMLQSSENGRMILRTLGFVLLGIVFHPNTQSCCEP